MNILDFNKNFINSSFEISSSKNLFTIQKQILSNTDEDYYQTFYDLFVYDSFAEKFVFGNFEPFKLDFTKSEDYLIYLSCSITEKLEVETITLKKEIKSNFKGYIEGKADQESFKQTAANYILGLVTKDRIIQNNYFESYLCTNLAIVNQSFGVILSPSKDAGDVQYLNMGLTRQGYY